MIVRIVRQPVGSMRRLLSSGAHERHEAIELARKLIVLHRQLWITQFKPTSRDPWVSW